MKEYKFYILLTDTGTFLTRMIKLYTKKPYNHASISFDSSLVDVYSFGRKMPRNPFVGGFVKENVRGSIIFKQARCAIYSCTVSSEQLEKMKEFIQEIEKNKHRYRYNFLGLLAITVNKRLQRNHAYFCSQFVATVLQEGGIVDFDKPLSFVTPHDLIDGTHFQLVYEGDLEEFQHQFGHSFHYSNEVQEHLI